MLLVAEIDQGVQRLHAFENNVTSLATVAAVGPSVLNKFLASERDRAAAAVAAFEIYFGFIEKFHSLPNQIKKEGWAFPLIKTQIAGRIILRRGLGGRWRERH